MMTFEVKKRVATVVIAVLIMFMPSFAFAFSPFGGKVLVITPCVDSFSGSYAVELSGPIGGTYIWSPAAKTYLHGPPIKPRQYALGLSIPLPSGCPTSIIKGVLGDFKGDKKMIMVGSSGLF